MTPKQAAAPMTDAEKNKRDAQMMLDNLADYNYSKTSMIDELVFEFGYTPEQAEEVYSDWAKVKA